MKRNTRVLALVITAGLFIAGGYLLSTWLAASRGAEASHQEQRADRTEAATRPLVQQLIDACKSNSHTADQLRQIGVCQAARDAKHTIAGGATLVPIPGPQGPRGMPGADGRDGVDGVDGVDGPPGPRGKAGRDGHDGIGSPGVDGRDGAAGPPGPPGPQGERGEPGVDGQDGARGQQGPPGPTCPEGYQPETRSIHTDEHPEGEQVLVCTVAAQ